MNFSAFFHDYFIAPIGERTGYNPVNTFVYALVALLFAYLIFRMLRHLQIPINASFFAGALSFTLFGALFRVAVDAEIYPYTFITTSPGIYFFIATLFFFVLFISHFLARPSLVFLVGIALSFFHLLILSPFFSYPLLFVSIVGLALFATLPCALFIPEKRFCLATFAHALDGSATFLTLSVFNPLFNYRYFEQHVVANFLNSTIGTLIDSHHGSFFPFFVIKLVFAYLFVVLLRREKLDEDEKAYLLLLVIIIGLAPGVRGAVRVLCGV